MTMKSIIYSIALGLAVITASSCKKFDNYDGPDQTLQGTIIDANNGRPMQSDLSGDAGGSAGTRIKLLETSWSANPTPLYLATKIDGTYVNTKVFAATYNISAEGAFVPLVQPAATPPVDQSKNLEVKGGTTTVDFTVEPLLEVEWVGTPVLNANGSITAQVKITRGTTKTAFQGNVTDLWLFTSPYPYIGSSTNSYDTRYATHVTYAGTTGTALLGTTITITTTLTSGALPKKDWYIRLAARTDYGGKLYNFSDMKMVTVN
jgi:hypothetical protein